MTEKKKESTSKQYQIVKIKDRFAIANEKGKIVDNAQGYGYKTEQSAHKAAWFLFEGGKQRIDEEKAVIKQLKKNHPKLQKYVDDFYSNNFKAVY